MKDFDIISPEGRKVIARALGLKDDIAQQFTDLDWPQAIHIIALARRNLRYDSTPSTLPEAIERALKEVNMTHGTSSVLAREFEIYPELSARTREGFLGIIRSGTSALVAPAAKKLINDRLAQDVFYTTLHMDAYEINRTLPSSIRAKILDKSKNKKNNGGFPELS